jgi:glycerate kinase
LARALLAPDSFKGTLTAEAVAEALAIGFEAAGWEVDRCPLADGGEGTAAVLLGGIGGTWVEARAADPLGRPIQAKFALLADGTAVVETAEASGLWRVSDGERDPLRADTTGTGELIAAAAQEAPKVLVAVGGSATTDGGAGALAAIDGAGGVGDTAIACLCDVTTPWERAASTFGPQKGASAAQVSELEARLDDLAARLPRDPRGVKRTGAAGGLAGGLWAALGAELVPGAAYVCDVLGLNERIARATVAVGAEGRLDATTLAGKVMSELAGRCADAGVPLHAVVGDDASDQAIRDALGLDSVWVAPDPRHLELSVGRIAAAA